MGYNERAWRCALLLAAMASAAGCSTGESARKPGPAPYLFVWAGPHMGDTAGGGASDFVAVLDADSASAGYGQVIASQEAGVAGDGPPPNSRCQPAPVFAGDHLAGRIVCSTSRIGAPRGRQIDSVGVPASAQLRSAAKRTCAGDAQFGARPARRPGGLAEFDAAGTLVGPAPPPTPPTPTTRPYLRARRLPAIDRVVTISSPMEMVRTVTSSSLKLSVPPPQTISVPPLAGDSIGRTPSRSGRFPTGSALLSTYCCGFYPVTGLDI
jgi:hypothetical protein